MAKSKLIDTLLLQRFWDGFKDVISSASTHIAITSGNPHNVSKTDVGLENVENKSSETIRNEITYDNVIDALGYVPTSATELEEVTFSIVDGNLIMYYPDSQVLPVVEVNDAGHLIYTV